MWAALVFWGALAFAVWDYNFGRTGECLEIARTLAETPVISVGWTLPQKIDCVFAPAEQRNKWLTNAQVLRFNATMLQMNLHK